MAKNRTVALVLPSLGRDGLQAGAERVAVTFAREFVEAGHRVDLVLGVTHLSSSAEVDPRVRIVDLRCRRLRISLPRLLAYRWRERPRLILSLMPLANRMKVLPSWSGPLGSRAALSECSAESITLDAHFSTEETRLLHPDCCLTYPHVAAIIGCSEGVAERSRAVYPSADCPTGLLETLDRGRYGTLVPVGNVEALAEAVIQTLDDPLDAARHAPRATEFAPPVIAARYLEVLGRATRGESLATAADR